MDAAEIFETWAPRESLWSRWAKGVLFSFTGQVAYRTAGTWLPPRETWTPPKTDEGWALVIDLPGRTAVDWGLAMAGHGYRPVPLFTSLPGQTNSEVLMGEVLDVLVQRVGMLDAAKPSRRATSLPAGFTPSQAAHQQLQRTAFRQSQHDAAFRVSFR